jgi:hypothetical protein
MFLAELNSGSQATQTEKDYLHDFPGFSGAFWLPLILSHPGDPTWHELLVDLLEVAKHIARRICAGLDRIRSLKPGAIAIIYVPVDCSF